MDSKVLRNDEVIQKQSFDQSYKNFWSFVDSNYKDLSEVVEVEVSSDIRNTNRFRVEEMGSGDNANPDEHNPENYYSQGAMTNTTDKISYGLTYQEARRRANELTLKKQSNNT